MDTDTQNIFFLGLCILFGWMIVILICASPQLFRDALKRGCCTESDERKSAEKIKKFLQAEARLQATRALAEKPSALLLGQVMAMSHHHSSPPYSFRPSLPLDLLEEGSISEEEEAVNRPGTSTQIYSV